MPHRAQIVYFMLLSPVNQEAFIAGSSIKLFGYLKLKLLYHLEHTLSSRK